MKRKRRKGSHIDRVRKRQRNYLKELFDEFSRENIA